MAFADDKTKTKTEYVPIGKGTFPARIVHLIDMGKQHIQGYNKVTKQWFPLYYAKDAEGNDIKDEKGYTKQVADDTGYPVVRPTYRVTYEFPTKIREFNGQQMPRWMKKDYTWGQIKKLAEALSVEPTGLPNQPCFVQIGVTEGGNDKIVSVSPVVEGMTVASLANSEVLFNFDEPEKDQWDNIPSWYAEDIKKATNYPGSKLEAMLSGSIEEKPKQGSNFDDFDDDIPF